MDPSSEPSAVNVWLLVVGATTVVITFVLVSWCVTGISNVGDDESSVTLGALALAPFAAWAVAFRLGRRDWPNRSSRLLAATVVALVVALGALFVRGLISGGL